MSCIDLRVGCVLLGALFLGCTSSSDDEAAPPEDLEQTSSAWTYNNATNRVGSVDVGGDASGGGLLYQDGHYYLMTAGHMAQPLGAWKNEYRPGNGTIGKVAYTTYPPSTGIPDIALIDTGTNSIPAIMRVSNGWTNAAITAYAAGNGDAPRGSWVCHSGWSQATVHAGGYRCGQLANDCTVSSNLCVITSAYPLASGGDSGGPVWWYFNGGVKMFGVMVSASYDGKTAYFVPVWTYRRQACTPTQTYGTGGYLMGLRPRCLLSTTGCSY